MSENMPLDSKINVEMIPATQKFCKANAWVRKNFFWGYKQETTKWMQKYVMLTLEVNIIPGPTRHQKFEVKQTQFYWKNIGTTIETFEKSNFQMGYVGQLSLLA